MSEQYDDLTAKAGASFEQPTPKMHQAVCIFVHDIGTQVSQYMGEDNIRRQIIVTWELQETMKNGDYAGKPFLINKFYTKSLGEKANLRKDLESWRGRSFSEQELAGFDLRKIIGAGCFLNLTETKNGKRAVSAITPLPTGYQSFSPHTKQPSEKFMEWINSLRAKSLEAKGGGSVEHQTAEEEESGDGLPF